MAIWCRCCKKCVFWGSISDWDEYIRDLPEDEVDITALECPYSAEVEHLNFDLTYGHEACSAFLVRDEQSLREKTIETWACNNP